jgi:hypothetical protein
VTEGSGAASPISPVQPYRSEESTSARSFLLMESCTGCGLVIAGGTDGCQSLFDDLRSRQYATVGSTYQTQRVTVDTYCMQHPDRYCVSAKSLAAHLTGLCWALEYSGHPAGLKALQRWLDGPGRIEKPAIPSFRGGVTVADVHDAPDGDALVLALQRWARATWDAYSPLHPIARRWVEGAL